MKLHKNLSINKTLLRQIFAGCGDVVFREFYSDDRTSCLLLYCDGMCDKDLLSDRVLKNIMASGFAIPENRKIPSVDGLTEKSMNVTEYTVVRDIKSVCDGVMSGCGVVIYDGSCSAVKISSTKFTSRAISEPDAKKVIRGPRDGFTENFTDSSSLLRRRLKTADFKMEYHTLRSPSPVRTALCYMKGVADEKRVEYIRNILLTLPESLIIDSGQLQNIIEKDKNTLFPSVQATERCDDAVFAIGEGKIVLLVENSPFVLIVPGLFLSMLTSSEDYYSSHLKRNIIIFVRIICSVSAVLLPALYIGFIKFTPDFLPDKIVLMIAGARENVALPPFTEIMFMQIIFEILLEAAVRLPGKTASAVGIVGSVVLGQAIVDAGIVNVTVIIIVSVSAVLTFVIPSYELTKSLRIIRVIFMAISSVAGIYGVCLGFMLLLTDLCAKDSFGCEYLFPFADNKNVKGKDIVF